MRLQSRVPQSSAHSPGAEVSIFVVRFEMEFLNLHALGRLVLFLWNLKHVVFPYSRMKIFSEHLLCALCAGCGGPGNAPGRVPLKPSFNR